MPKKAQNGLRPPFLGVSRAKKHPKNFPGRLPAAGPYGRIAPEGGLPVSPQPEPGGESKREGGRIEIIFFYGELGDLGEPN